jgi:uncharacterized protein (TIGR00159 family)
VSFLDLPFLLIFDSLLTWALLTMLLQVLQVWKHTRLLVALVALLLAWVISGEGVLHLRLFHRVLTGGFVVVGLIALVAFQQDLRRILQSGNLQELLGLAKRPEEQIESIEELARAAQMMSDNRIGGLVVLQQRMDLESFRRGGIPLDAELRAELVYAIFNPHKASPLHDGAVLVVQGRIVAAACLLPLSTSTRLDRSLGTRHRAAVGLAEQTDAVVLVVSEETGWISLVDAEGLRQLDPGMVRSALRERLQPRGGTGRTAAMEAVRGPGGAA